MVTTPMCEGGGAALGRGTVNSHAFATEAVELSREGMALLRPPKMRGEESACPCMQTAPRVCVGFGELQSLESPSAECCYHHCHDQYLTAKGGWVSEDHTTVLTGHRASDQKTRWWLKSSKHKMWPHVDHWRRGCVFIQGNREMPGQEAESSRADEPLVAPGPAPRWLPFRASTSRALRAQGSGRQPGLLTGTRAHAGTPGFPETGIPPCGQDQTPILICPRALSTQSCRNSPHVSLNT